MFTIDLPQQIETRLLILAMSTGRTIEYCAREAILDYIDEIEERCLARQRAESILALRASKREGVDCGILAEELRAKGKFGRDGKI